MANATNVYTLSETVVDSEGKKHKVFPVQISYLGEVAQFLANVNTDFIFASFMIPDTDNEGCIIRDNETGKIIYGTSMIDDLVHIVEIAVRFRETAEDIRQWLDICLAQEIIEILIGLSQVKKKMMEPVTK